jgi:Cellulase (glycosyl hydrolase family 5)
VALLRAPDHRDRGCGPSPPLIVESTLFDDSGTLVEPLSAPNIVYSPHFYFGSLVKVPFEQDSPNAPAARLRQRSFEARLLPAPLWIGELGIDGYASGAAAYTQSAVTTLDELGSGWTWWQWRQDGGWGIRSTDGRRLDAGSLARLARPYLQAAPAGVTATAADHGLAISVDAGANGGARLIEVAYPGLTRGRPEAAGGCLVDSSWSEGELVLSVAPGAACSIAIR